MANFIRATKRRKRKKTNKMASLFKKCAGAAFVISLLGAENVKVSQAILHRARVHRGTSLRGSPESESEGGDEELDDEFDGEIVDTEMMQPAKHAALRATRFDLGPLEKLAEQEDLGPLEKLAEQEDDSISSEETESSEGRVDFAQMGRDLREGKEMDLTEWIEPALLQNDDNNEVNKGGRVVGKVSDVLNSRKYRNWISTSDEGRCYKKAADSALARTAKRVLPMLALLSCVPATLGSAEADATPTCINQDGWQVDVGDHTGIVILAGFATFYMAWGIGANDCANNFGTSWGSGALSWPSVVIIGAIMEFLGAVLLGSDVAKTFRKGIADIDLYQNDDGRIMVLTGMTSVLIGAAGWLMMASKWGLPVSTTHSAVGGVIAFGIV